MCNWLPPDNSPHTLLLGSYLFKCWRSSEALSFTAFTSRACRGGTWLRSHVVQAGFVCVLYRRENQWSDKNADKCFIYKTKISRNRCVVAVSCPSSRLELLSVEGSSYISCTDKQEDTNLWKSDSCCVFLQPWGLSSLVDVAKQKPSSINPTLSTRKDPALSISTNLIKSPSAPAGPLHYCSKADYSGLLALLGVRIDPV